MSSEPQTTQPIQDQAVIKIFTPQCSVLNDNDSGIDHLGTAVYAKALADQIQHIETPVTFGIFARWGTGKSFLLKHIQSIIKKRKKQNDIKLGKNKKSKCSLCLRGYVFFLSILCLIGISLCLLIDPPFSNLNTVKDMRIAVSVILIVLVLLLASRFSCNVRLKKYGFRNKMVLMYAKFTKLPILMAECSIASATKEEKIEVCLDDTKTDREDENSGIEKRYIFVNFNAWKYAGSDNLWAGLVLALADKIEEEFSSFTTRSFRSINLDKIAKGHGESCDVYMRIKGSVKTVREIAEAYGVVQDCKTYAAWMAQNNHNAEGSKKDNEWVVTYIDKNCARIAVDVLKKNTFQAKILMKTNKTKASKVPEVEKSLVNNERPQPNTKNESPILKSNSVAAFFRHFLKHPKKHCFIQDLYCIICLVMTLTLIPLAVTLTAEYLIKLEDSDEKEENKTMITQVLAWMPAAAAFLYAVCTSIYSLVHSQTSRIEDALKGVEGNLANELGFMHKVKEEVEFMTDIVHTVEFIYNVKYKVIITVDDLDRIPLHKIRRVLEAVNLLLSDRSSPFVCLIAVDSRVAVESLEKDERDDSSRAKISGHEYLKKIINVPFCLPEITKSDKRNYVAGLIDDSDKTFSHRRQVRNVRDAACLENEDDVSDTSSNNSEFFTFTKSIAVKKKDLQPCSLKKFQVKCREYMLDDTLLNHLEGNPRSIKRIFNVISITSTLIKCHQDMENNSMNLKALANQSKSDDSNKQSRNDYTPSNTPTATNQISTSENHVMHNHLAKNIVTWVILTDQWPYRTSYILQVIEDSDQRKGIHEKNKGISDNEELHSIYIKHVIPEINTSDKDILNLDGDPDIFRSFLSKQPLTKGTVRSLLKYTINLDQGLKNTVAISRAIMYLKTEQTNTKEKSPSSTENKPENKEVPHDDKSDQLNLTEVDTPFHANKYAVDINMPTSSNHTKLTKISGSKPKIGAAELLNAFG